MVIVDLKDQLGNQMFAYASIKSICLDKGLDFGFYRTPLEAQFINDTNKKYGNDLSTIFSLPKSECIESLPKEYGTYYELPLSERSEKNYSSEVRNSITDNTIAEGHFITCDFLYSHLQEMREWFSFPEDIQKSCREAISDLRAEYKGRPLVSIHFRVGRDYFIQGFKLGDSYWTKAADLVKRQLNDPIFIVFYDKKTRFVEKFIKENNAIDLRKSLVEDMCMISLCDANIVCNSTFSVMAALLNCNSTLAVCPSCYPIRNGYMPKSVFPSEWTKIIGCKRDELSTIFGAAVPFLLQLKRTLLSKFLGKFK